MIWISGIDEPQQNKGIVEIIFLCVLVDLIRTSSEAHQVVADLHSTRMHSCRMHTARSMTSSSSIRGGGVGAEACMWGCACPLGVPRGACMLGVACMEYSPPPWTEFLTQACENIIFPQLLLQAVKTLDVHHSSDQFSSFSCSFQQILANNRLVPPPPPFGLAPPLWNTGSAAVQGILGRGLIKGEREGRGVDGWVARRNSIRINIPKLYKKTARKREKKIAS